MTTTYTWSIPENGLITVPTLNGQTNVVTSVRYSVVATDGTHTAKIENTAVVRHNPDQPFTQFSGLTEAQVISWVQSSQPNLVANIQRILDRKIANLINPPVRPVPRPNPWSTN